MLINETFIVKYSIVLIFCIYDLHEEINQIIGLIKFDMVQF